MKHFVILFTLFLCYVAHAQEEEAYQMLWNQVEKLEKGQLTQSALKLVRSIQEKAKKENNSAQRIKGLLYASKYGLILEENARLTIVNDFKDAIRRADFPTKNILESYLGNLYWQYFQQNRYLLYDRTKTETPVDSSDFRTWDLTTLFEEIDRHFNASLENTPQLQTLGVDQFQEILTKQEGSEIYRPTLFDLLAHTALTFYETREHAIARPADKFEMDDPRLLSDAYEFVQQHLDLTDRNSTPSKALHIYQDLLKFHFSDVRLEALAHVDIERLKFVHQHAVFPNRDALYLNALENAAENLGHHEVSALYRYEIARLYQQLGNSYQPKTKEEHRWKLKEALTQCELVLAQFPESQGAGKCRALQSEILTKSLQLTVEQHVPIDSPSRILVNYKNLDGLQLTAYKASNADFRNLDELYPESKKLEFIKGLPLIQQWEASLKNEIDFQQHGMEILMPGWGNGQYIILAVPRNRSDETFAYAHIQVTDLALVQTQTPDFHQFQLIDRNNGRPLENIELQLTYRENYNGTFLTKTLATDATGSVRIPLDDKRRTSLSIQAVYKDDSAHFGSYHINAKPKSGKLDAIDHKVFLFTDRSIYRPGQILYFKGIAITRENKASKILSHTPLTVSLMDVNSQEVSQVEFTSNAYGSFSGTFILPTNGLTGNFSLQVSSKSIPIDAYKDFSVEEYKRPKFHTSLETPVETYRVNDSITVKGTAKAYAGSTVTDAQVVYTVRRVVNFPRWYDWSRPFPTIAPQEIAQGSAVTDASGNFAIPFKAIPDESVDKDQLPTFNYEVTADVTDINGETRTAVSVVRVGYHSLQAEVKVEDRMDKNVKAHRIEIATANLNGKAVGAQGTLALFKLQAPKNVLRKRPWAAPDYQNWDKNSFKKLFPHDAYGAEHDAATWAKGKLVWQGSFNTAESTEVSLEMSKKWESGRYLLELRTEDRFGQEVTAQTHTSLFSEKNEALADNQLFDIQLDKSEYLVGQRAKISLSSSAKNVYVSVSVEKNRKIVDTRTLKLNKDIQSFTVPIREPDLGGFAVHYSFSAFNAFVSGTLTVPVPYPKTDLDIETLTFRDKLRPNTTETWTFKLKGPQGNKVAAELLASMYDSSLDAFRKHAWNAGFDYRPSYYSRMYRNAYQSFGTEGFRLYDDFSDGYDHTSQRYDSFNWFGLHFGHIPKIAGYANGSVRKSGPPSSAPIEILENSASLEEVVITGSGLLRNDAVRIGTVNALEVNKNEQEESDLSTIPIRQNLQETTFFFPELYTDQEGHLAFSFTTPEALTTWKLQLLAHDQKLRSGYASMESITQKELMVIPNAPRFLREGDELTFTAKIANLTDKKLVGLAQLQLRDALTNSDITLKLLSVSLSGNAPQQSVNKEFTVDSLGNAQVSWRLKVPKGIQAVQYTLWAKAGDFSDGEENLLPVLTNSTLVTESLPMWVGGDQAKTFVLEKLQNPVSATLRHHKLTLEITSNPAWYALQALPYLMEYPHECNEQIFAKYYANSLAAHLVNGNPRIRQVFDQWQNSDAAVSHLERNPELKSILIQETPWLRDAQSETEQKKRIALLFDLNTMRREQDNSLGKLQLNQLPSGAWTWFKGGKANRWITQHIVSGLGHLQYLKVAQGEGNTSPMIQNAVNYLDNEFVKEYEELKKYKKNLKEDHLNSMQVHYLYIRSFFPDIEASEKVRSAIVYYQGQAQKFWTKKNLYSKGMLALALYRMGDEISALKILQSLEENSIYNEEFGRYWKANRASWHWYQAPIETQALMIEAFSEVQYAPEIVNELKVWLLKHKQTNQWETTKATTEAIYALLLQGSDWLSVAESVEVTVGGERITPAQWDDLKPEAGTGYFKTEWSGTAINSKMAQVTMTKNGEGVAWGGLYWQYFEDLDKITASKSPLQLDKRLFLKKHSDTGPVISPISLDTDLIVGDLLRVRIELRADRNMEFIHLKDMRAAGLEPVNVISGYKWQDGLGYYESTKDAGTHFFFDHLPKGVYVFEYDLRVNTAGNFSSGISTIQSMYAPEFGSHSEGVRIQINERH